MADPRLYKRSQRPTWSCTECARRKIRCDKKVPCQACVKRNAAHLCSLDHDTINLQQPTGFATPGLYQSGFAMSSSPTGSGNGDVMSLVHQLSSTVSDLDRRLRAVEGVQRRHGNAQETRSPVLSTYDHANENSPVSASSSRVLQSSPMRKFTQQGPSSEGVADTALTFEYLALGRDRNRDIMHPRQNGQPLPTTDNILATALHEPLPERVQAALLPPKALDYVLTFAKDVVAWQHACIHIPTFQRECEAFYSLQPVERWLWTDPLWLALYFVIQSIAVHQMPPNDVEHIVGYYGRSIPGLLLEAAVKCLEVGRYLSEPSLFTCQALAILCVAGHNVADSNLLSSYLAIGIKTAQMLNLHHLAGESTRVEARLQAEGGMVMDGSAEWRSRIVRLEMGKRIWWSLVQQDYLALPFCGTSMINPRHHDTPLPANVHDDELDQGRLQLHYDESDLTLVQKLRLTAKMAQIIYAFFEQLPHRQSPCLEDHVQPYESQLLELLPSTQPRSANPALKFGLALRRYINIGVSHKILVLHRTFCSLHPSPAPAQLHASQARCLDAARQVLEQVRGIKPSGRPEGQVGAMWTVSYQAVAAAMVVALTYFRAGPSRPSSEPANQLVSHQEMMDARKVLQSLTYRSTIAQRGVQLMDDLMHGYEEAERQSQVLKRDLSDNGESPHKRMRNDDKVVAEPSVVPDLDEWDVASVLQSMPDVSKLFDGSMGNPFGTF